VLHSTKHSKKNSTLPLYKFQRTLGLGSFPLSFQNLKDEASHSSSQKCPLESSPHHINELSQLLMSNLTRETTFKKKKKLYKQSRKL
jgi:hypothetical protein